MIVPEGNLRRNNAQPWRPEGATLSNEHRRELEASAISPEIRDARGYWTAEGLADVPECFPKWQRRRGMVVPSPSPDGVSVVHQLKPKKPIRRKNGDAPKYETPTDAPVTLDCNPLMLEALRSGTGDAWLTEGAKKVDALASVGEPAVGGRGVHMFAEPGTKGAVPLRCWNFIRVEGRTWRIVFDADARTNPGVQEGLRRSVAMLEGMGARVLVVYLPAVNGDTKAGVDDYLAAGGTVAELKLMAASYEPVDVGAARLEQDEALRRALEDLWHRWRAQTWSTRGDYSARSIFRALIRRAERSGVTVAEGVQVEAAKRPLAEEAAVSDRAVTRAIPRLEEMGILRRDNEGRKRDAAGRFVLLTSAHEVARYCPQNGERGTEGEGEVRQEVEGFSDVFTGASYPRGDTNALVPELRFSTIRFYREQHKPGRWERRGHYVARLEKKRGRIVEVLVSVGGTATLAELVEELGSKSEKTRPWDFRRRTLGPLVDAGIVAVEGDTVTLAERWHDALEDARELTEEIRDARLQAQKHRRASAAYRARNERPADPVPDMTPIPDMRQSWALHPTGCACPSCEEKLGRVIGEHVEGCCCASCFTARKAEDGGNVVALPRREKLNSGVKKSAAKSATVAGLEDPHDPGGDWRDHALSCKCRRCAAPEPNYATAWSAS